MSRLLIRNARLVNEGQVFDADVLIANGRIEKIAASIQGDNEPVEIDANGQWLLPGMIDDQVHFREPGAPEKGSFYSESRAAVAGGITSFMDMPNTHPATLNLEALADKKRRAALHSVANYGFHFGVSNDNLDTVAALAEYRPGAQRVIGGRYGLGSKEFTPREREDIRKAKARHQDALARAERRLDGIEGDGSDHGEAHGREAIGASPKTLSGCGPAG